MATGELTKNSAAYKLLRKKLKEGVFSGSKAPKTVSYNVFLSHLSRSRLLYNWTCKELSIQAKTCGFLFILCFITIKLATHIFTGHLDILLWFDTAQMMMTEQERKMRVYLISNRRIQSMMTWMTKNLLFYSPLIRPVYLNHCIWFQFEKSLKL